MRSSVEAVKQIKSCIKLKYNYYIITTTNIIINNDFIVNPEIT